MGSAPGFDNSSRAEPGIKLMIVPLSLTGGPPIRFLVLSASLPPRASCLENHPVGIKFSFSRPFWSCPHFPLENHPVGTSFHFLALFGLVLTSPSKYENHPVGIKFSFSRPFWSCPHFPLGNHPLLGSFFYFLARFYLYFMQRSTAPPIPDGYRTRGVGVMFGVWGA